MANFSSVIDCAEESNSCNESYDDERGILKASVQLRCAWSDRHLLVADICGNRLAWPKGAAGQVPLAATAAIVPVETPGSPSASGQEMLYGEALVTINYTTEIVDIVSESIEPYAEFITLDHKWFRWGAADGDVLREEEAPGKLVRGINFVRTELNKTSVAAALITLIGHVNNATVVGSIINFSYPAETLLFAPPSISYKKDSTGVTKFDITKKFTYNEHGWNKFYRSNTAAWTSIYVAGGAEYKNYPVTDLSGLFA